MIFNFNCSIFRVNKLADTVLYNFDNFKVTKIYY